MTLSFQALQMDLSPCYVCGELFDSNDDHQCSVRPIIDETPHVEPIVEYPKPLRKSPRKVSLSFKGGQLQLKPGFRCEACHGEFSKQSDLETHWADCESNARVTFWRGHTIGNLQNELPMQKANISDDDDEEEETYGDVDCKECCVQFANGRDRKKHFIEAHVQQAVGNHNNRLNRNDLIRAYRSGKEAEYKAFIEHTEKTNRPPIFGCSICEEAYREKLELFEHMATVHDKRVLFQCHECDMLFVQRLALARHLQGHAAAVESLATSKSKAPYECAFCGKEFTFRSYYHRHVATHTTESSYLCDICGDEFRSQGALVLHKTKHSGQDPHKCRKCGKLFPYRSYLERHYTTHIAAPSECTVCGKVFNIPAHLKKHMALQHSDVGSNLTCPHCERKFMYPSGLERHLATHLPAKDNECPICQRRFGSRNALVSHVQRHLPDSFQQINTFQCGFCPNAYRFESNLQRHIERVHEKIHLDVASEDDDQPNEDLQGPSASNAHESVTVSFM